MCNFSHLNFIILTQAYLVTELCCVALCIVFCLLFYVSMLFVCILTL
jgi:hypothetical protein